MLTCKSVMRESELAGKTNALTTIHYLEVSEGYIAQGTTEDGAPDGLYRITDTGREFVLSRKRERAQFWRNFLSHFVTGLLTGSVGTLALEHLILHFCG